MTDATLGGAVAPWLDDGDVQLHHGDVIQTLRELPAGIAQTCVTSPPYWGLRSYLPDGHDDKATELGLEATPDLYVERMVAVFREVWRVLRDDGTCWINLGDSYNANQGAGFNGQKRQDDANRHTVMKRTGFKPKDLVGIPWRVAFALQTDGWYLRSDIVWNKPNPMPESVTDRPTKAHEYLFLLAKRPRYFYDADAIREPGQERQYRGDRTVEYANGTSAHVQPYSTGASGYGLNPAGRNRRSVWTIGYNIDEEVEWTGKIGQCRVCGGLRVAGNGPDPTTEAVTDASAATTANVEHIESSTRPSSAPSLLDSPSTTPARTPDASTPPTSNQSASETTSCEATHPPLGTPPRRPASTATASLPQTLIDALTAAGNAVCVCETGCGRGDKPSVWRIATEPFSAAHFATYPQALVRPCILAGTSEKGECVECGAPWMRETEHGAVTSTGGSVNGARASNMATVSPLGQDPERSAYNTGAFVAREKVTTGWRASCSCDAPTRPQTVLDPFIGSGTTALVARNHGRRCIGIDLSAEYLAIAAKRLQQLSLLGELA